MAGIPQRTQMASLWTKAYSPSTLKDSKGCCGALLATMSISAILLGYHTGLPIAHAGNVMQRTRGVTMPLFILSTYCSAKAFFLTLDWQHFALLLLKNEGPGVRTAQKTLGKLSLLWLANPLYKWRFASMEILPTGSTGIEWVLYLPVIPF